MPAPLPAQIATLIIGAGFGGLCMGAKLSARGDGDFLIVDKAGGVGGTWRHNIYPGAECDVPSALYSYSFAPNPTWDFKWAKQAQILSYLEGIADDFGLRARCRFETEVTGAVFDDAAKRWSVQFNGGQSVTCQFLVSAVGQLHHPRFGSFAGRSDFKGPQFHSAQWDSSVNLSGKNIAVIGNAASAVQLIPELQKIAGKLTVYQRSANWIIPKGDRPYSRLEKWIAARFPGLGKLYRGSLWASGEYFLYPVICGARIRSTVLRAVSILHMRSAIKDPAMRAALTPKYPIGAKRVLLSDKIYPALAQDNVKLVATPIKRFEADGVVDVSDERRAHDIIVHATGFITNPFLKNLNIYGRGGQSLQDHWSDGARAYLGLMTHGFPNLFMMYGPNTNTGHTSIIYKHEAQADGILALINHAAGGMIEVLDETENEFNAEMQARLSDMTWAKIDGSWYQDRGRITNNWPGPSREYTRRARKLNVDHFVISGSDGDIVKP